jgi:hypothetical protein
LDNGRRSDAADFGAAAHFLGRAWYNVVMVSRPAILERVLGLNRADFPAEVAREMLKFSFPPDDRDRYRELSAKAQDGVLSEEERSELEDYLNVDDLLIMLKAKAEASLRGSAA